MPADLRDHQADRAPATRDSSQHRRWALVLLTASAWNIWLWITRAWNLANDPTPRTTGFVVVHAILYGVSFVFAIAIGVIGWRLLRASRSTRR